MTQLRDRIVELRRIPVGELVPNARTWRTHDAKQKAALRGLLADVGFAGALLARLGPGGEVLLIDGHLRRETLPGEVVPVLITDLTEEEADKVLATYDPLAAMAGRDNALLASLLEGVSTQDPGLQKMLQELGQSVIQLGATDPDEAGSAPRETTVRPGQVYELGAHRLMCGESTKDVATLLGTEVPNLMVTDPPYGVNYDPAWRWGARRIGTVQNDDRADWTDVWRAFPGNVAYCWHGDLHAGEVWTSLLMAEFEVRYQIIWAKRRFVISRGAYHWQHEPCFYAVRKGATASWEGDRSQTTLWSVETALDANDTSDNHSTQKPVELFRRPIMNHTRAGDAVFEPFSGSGSCIIAGEQTGRRVLAMELDPLYVDQAIRRWERFTQRSAVLVG